MLLFLLPVLRTKPLSLATAGFCMDRVEAMSAEPTFTDDITNDRKFEQLEAGGRERSVGVFINAERSVPGVRSGRPILHRCQEYELAIGLELRSQGREQHGISHERHVLKRKTIQL